MRLITAHELTHRSERDLRALFSATSAALAQAAPGSDEERVARASLENICRALALKRFAPRP
jgi:hypothetical protein